MDLAAALREQLAGLQRDASALRRDLDRLTAEVGKAEQAAMAAVGAGDDTAARAALGRQQQFEEKVGVGEAELRAVQSLIERYRDMLAAAGSVVDDAAPAAMEAPVDAPAELHSLMASLADAKKLLRTRMPGTTEGS